MKSRLGFISNSSSSSFIAIGCHKSKVKFPDDWDELLEDIEFYDEVYDNLYVAIEEGYLGTTITYISDDEGIGVEDIPNLQEIKQAFLDKCKELNIEVDPNEVKLISGTIGC